MTAIVLDLPVGTQVGGARIAMAAAVLDWDEASGKDIHRDFVLLLGDRLGAVLSVLPDARGDRLKESLAALPDEGWLRLLTSPRASYQLLWPSRHSPVDIAEFLENAIAAEQARARSMGVAAVTKIYPTDDKRWSALGDGYGARGTM